MPEGEWKVGRAFTVLETVVLDGMTLNPGAFYTAQVFGRIGAPGGRAWPITNESRAELLDIIVWADAPSKISPALRRLIEQDPESRFIRLFLRSEIGTVPKRAEMPVTAEKWFEFIEKAEPPKRRGTTLPVTTTANTATTGVFTTATTATTVAANQTLEMLDALGRMAGTTGTGDDIRMNIRVEANQRVTGQASFSRNDYYSGEIPVPARILAQGTDEVHQWVVHNIAAFLDPDDQGDNDYYDEEITDSGRIELQDTNINRVVRDFQRLYPEMARRLGGQ